MWGLGDTPRSWIRSDALGECMRVTKTATLCASYVQLYNPAEQNKRRAPVCPEKTSLIARAHVLSVGRRVRRRRRTVCLCDRVQNGDCVARAYSNCGCNTWPGAKCSTSHLGSDCERPSLWLKHLCVAMWARKENLLEKFIFSTGVFNQQRGNHLCRSGFSFFLLKLMQWISKRGDWKSQMHS